MLVLRMSDVFASVGESRLSARDPGGTGGYQARIA